MRKKKVILPPDLPPVIGEEDVEVSDEDLKFFQSNRGYAGFLKNLDTKSIDRHVGRVADVNEDDLEALYEKRKKKASLQKPFQEEELQVDRVDVLPLKTLDGKLYYRTVEKSKTSTTPNNDEAALSNDLDDQVDKNILRLTKAERRLKLKKTRKEAKKQAKIEAKFDITVENPQAEVLASVEEDLTAEEIFVKKKNKIAEIGISLLENPEANIKFLKELTQLCHDVDKKLVKLALLSLLAVFKDIIPGYRIRLPTEKELNMNVSKEVRKMRFYETSLLHSYKAYLIRLIGLEKKLYFRHVAVRCMCNLLEAVPHFNFRESLLSSIVKNIGSSDDIIRKVCCSAIKSVFANEGKHGGEATVEAVQLIANLVKNHDCQLHPDSIEVFLALKFDDEIGRSLSLTKEKRKPKKKNWKKHEEPKLLPNHETILSKQELAARTRDEVNADLKAASLAIDFEERKRIQTETLSSIFETYFRILKHTMDSGISRSTGSTASSMGIESHPLLAPCLRGLAKFSHLIDLDFMNDLMKCLKKLSGSVGCDAGGSLKFNLSVTERMQCCIVAFKVMANNLDALNVDLQDLFIQLYNLLLEYRPHRDKGEVFAEALKIMLCEGKQHDMQRAAAFIKRLATFSLCYGSAETMAALVTLKHLLQKNIKCRYLLENDAGGGSLSGLVVKYQPDVVDPNLSGALASVLWELSLLTKHYHPTVSCMASSISSMNTSQNPPYLSMTSPQQAFADLSIDREPFKVAGKAILKRKRRNTSGSISIFPNTIHETKSLVDEDDMRTRFENYFAVVRNMSEHERLRGELNKTLTSINLYDEYKKQRKRKRVGKLEE